VFITAHKASLHKTTVPASVHAWLGAAAALLVAVQALVGPAKAASPVSARTATTTLWLLPSGCCFSFLLRLHARFPAVFRCKVRCGRSTAALASRL
jgi:hypothetical protein